MAHVAIVTGGTRGIGEAISIALRDEGVTVAANYAGNEEKARQFTDRTGIKAYKWDVSDFDACMEGCRRIEEELAIRGRETFLAAGGSDFAYLPCLNDSEAGIEMLRSIVGRELEGWTGRN